MRKYLFEFIATFALVFAGTGAVMLNDLYAGAVTGAGVALVFGLVVAAMIYAVGDVSGAHLNPAVTLGFWAAGRLPVREVAPYVLSQCAGALFASLILRVVFPWHPTLGATLPAGAVYQSFAVEVVIAAVLVFVVLSVTARGRGNMLLAGAAIGAVVALGAFFAGPVSGGSMNPARSLAPAIVSGRLEHLWLYLIAPFIGAGLAVSCCMRLWHEGCCRAVQGGGCR